MEALSAWTILWCVFVGFGALIFWLFYFIGVLDETRLNDKPFGMVAGTWILCSLLSYLTPLALVGGAVYMLIRGLYWLPKTANFWIKEYRNV